MKLSFILLVLFLPVACAFSQNTASLAYAENSMKAILEEVRNAPGDNERLDANTRFLSALTATLGKKGAFDYQFDSLRGVTSVFSPDRRFRVFTWPLQLAGGEYRYSGILVVPDKKGGSARITVLRDTGDSLTDPESAILTPERWLGAVYYQVIPVKDNEGKAAYTLLGWRGISLLVSSRMIDILSLDSDGSVTFGRTIFCDKERLRSTRIIFRYAARASMVLTYEKQALVTGKKWNPSSREFETERIREMMIVCDRILPADQQMEGRFEYYLPSSEIMDGYLFRDGCWNLIREIDARNPTRKPKPPPKIPEN